MRLRGFGVASGLLLKQANRCEVVSTIGGQ